MEVEALQCSKRRQFLMMALKSGWNGQLHITRWVQARRQDLFEVFHALSHCLSIRVICLEGHPTWWLWLRCQTCPIHTTDEQAHKASLIQLRTISVLSLKLFLQHFNKVSYIAHHKQYVSKVDQIDLMARSGMQLRINVCLDMRTTLKPWIYD